MIGKMTFTMFFRHLLTLILAFCYATGLSVIFANAGSPHKNFSELTIAAIDTFYISPSGSNATGDGGKTNPWRSVTFALNQLSSDSLKPKVVKLANGVYSAAATGESFPLNLKSWISFVGSDSVKT
jgi:hypothetical protein